MSQIHDTLVSFVKVLRTADIKVSPAETLDAMETLDIVGLEDREFLKNSLSLVLSKNPEEKEAFDSCFDRFFSFDKFKSPEEDDTPANDDAFEDKGEFDADSGQSGQPGAKVPVAAWAAVKHRRKRLNPWLRPPILVSCC